MASTDASASLSFLSPLLLLALLAAAVAAPLVDPTEEEAIGIGIGIGTGIGIGIGIGGGGGGGGAVSPNPGGCPPPPPPPPSLPPPPPPKRSPPPPPKRSPPSLRCPQPRCFENIYLYRAYLIIQRFKKTITHDPLNITGTWNGFNICNNDNKGYKGFYCETPPTRKGKNMRGIAAIDFNGFHLAAPNLAGYIDRFTDAALFHANSNSFGGTVPAFAPLRFFFELDVSNNHLSGAFPVQVTYLFNSTFIDIRYNRFYGAVLPAVFHLNATYLFLNNNNFNGSIPADIGATTAGYLTLANNQFTGPIPRSIGATSETLIEVLFLNNRLTGCLPFEAGLLRKATVFDAGYNQITGPIPLSFGCLAKVEQLNLAGNLLYGEVPDVVCRLGTYGHLLNLSLSDNFFTSLGKSCWSLINFKKLDVRKNCIPGLPNQRSSDECKRFLILPKPFCPNRIYIPCRLPWEGKEELGSSVAASSSAMDGRQDRNPATGSYTSYAALQGRQEP